MCTKSSRRSLPATRASSDRVKSFAAMMIEQHTITTREVTAEPQKAVPIVQRHIEALQGM